jgi:hypothetical protein
VLRTLAATKTIGVAARCITLPSFSTDSFSSVNGLGQARHIAKRAVDPR